MALPFRVGVMQLTMEPLDEILEHARLLDEHGFDTIWLAEAYPWWRKHQMEARSSTALSPLIARETSNLTVGWGIISPYTRHPIQVAMEARVVQEAAGPGRFRLGLWRVEDLHEGDRARGRPPARPLTAIRDSVRIVKGVLGGSDFSYEGREFSAFVPALSDEADVPRDEIPIYVAGTGPKRKMAGEEADGLLTASISTPAFVRYSYDNMAEGSQGGRP